MYESEELPNIRFKSREARRLKHRHEIENKKSVEQKCTVSNNSETARIPPLPDPSLFIPDNERNRHPSSERSSKSRTTKTPKSLKKKRQSIEAIKTKEREILGDLFAVDKSVKVVKRKVLLKDLESDKINNKRPKSIRTGLVKKESSSKEALLKSLKEKGSNKLQYRQNVDNKSLSSSGKSVREREHSTQTLHASDKTCQGKTQLKDENFDKANVGNDKDSNHCEVVRRLTKGTTEQIAVKNVVNEVKRVAQVADGDRHVSDSSDMCHQVNCSRSGPFDLLISLDRNYRKELENLKVSPRSENAVRFDKIPIVKIKTSQSLLKSDRKSKSIESSGSESDSEKGRRHFTDVFSDISEPESDSGVKPVNDKDFDHVLSKDKVFIDVDSGDNDDLDKTLIECKNYFVKTDQFSDISDNESAAVECVISDTDENIDINTPLGGNDYLGNSALSITVTDSDSDVIFVDMENASENKAETSMPKLEVAIKTKSKSLIQSFEMPILEKYTEVYSSLRDGACEQEVLPDIEEDSVDISDNVMKAPELFQKNINVLSSGSSEANKVSCNLFKKFTLTNDDSSDLTSVSETVSSSFRPYSSQASSSSSLGMKHCNSDITLSSPKECSTPKSRKRKLHKSRTYSSFGNSEIFSNFTSLASTSQSEKLSFTKQMDQLTVYMKDFLNLSDSKTLPPKIPGAQKNIVYGCEEDGLLNLGHALNFIENFCRKYIIPSDLCKDVINSAFQSECSLSHIHWAYNLLSELNALRTAEIDISWETIESCLNTALTASQGKPYYQLLQSTLLLQLGSDVLKMDLFSRNLSDNREIRKSYAYKMFAYDVSTESRKRLIYFLNQALHAGQCRTEEENKFRLPDVLPMLQDLLALCVDVSSSCIDCANILAADMVNTYKFLPNLSDKQLLIQSVSSQLLQCKLVQLVLESQYDCHQTLGSAFPDSLEDIIQCFFKVMPLKNPLTPPTTPNDEIQREDDGEFSMFSPEVTEEIALLLYFMVVSYLQASSDKMYMALRLRVNVPEAKKRLRSDDEVELSKMHEHACDLEHHLRCMNPNLTENTEHYLFLMKCLGELVQEQ
ncbi:uncharacterized protein LOC132712964 isoform X2 [Ruditapes philippinarum]|nr:uncharacterized protein LOC132712964 isoform X2 [Ruditapes philippinarum]XP_060551386.1 uncharacterized protein LOC132712964 isoform X2 [Ruditapes philippinarum]XP_060551387.1 uncharacterized protein LOC132712964 isoform X2 [Ruditapes philippinarum]XP_060551389.1 uncharacterized protein LOC132712964 isoform X2 [Ruditapes philippinarum]XP_060551390.1 uncharacterized protein LOC132712964 isoform X2 [Ruditapes philippinarum]